MPPVLQAAIVLICPALLLTAAARDAVTFTIPNWISLALLAIFPLAAFAVGLPFSAIGPQMGVGFAALLVGMAMFFLRWIGGGDAKLFAAVALWLGWPSVIAFVVYTCLAGGVLAVGLNAMRSGVVRPFLLGGPSWVVRLAEPQEAIPYGVAIALGGLAAFVQSPFAPALGL